MTQQQGEVPALDEAIAVKFLSAVIARPPRAKQKTELTVLRALVGLVEDAELVRLGESAPR
jgi:hypothetical protein